MLLLLLLCAVGVDRQGLTAFLVDEATRRFPDSITFHFGVKPDLDLAQRVVRFVSQGSNQRPGSPLDVWYDLLVGADGAGSSVRAALEQEVADVTVRGGVSLWPWLGLWLGGCLRSQPLHTAANLADGPPAWAAAVVAVAGCHPTWCLCQAGPSSCRTSSLWPAQSSCADTAALNMHAHVHGVSALIHVQVTRLTSPVAAMEYKAFTGLPWNDAIRSMLPADARGPGAGMVAFCAEQPAARQAQPRQHHAVLPAGLGGHNVPA